MSGHALGAGVLVAAALAVALVATGPRRPARLPAARSPGRDGRSGRAAALVALAATAAVLAGPLPTATVAGAVVGGLRWHRHRARHRRRAALSRALGTQLPDAIDLLLLCTGAGLALPAAHRLVAEVLPPPLGPALAAADAATAAGERRADALVAALRPLGDSAERLAHLLADHLRYGTALGPGLERLGAELRALRRHRAEEDARRVPVRLLGPLVACVLPAFGLLTVVPLLAASLRSLPT